MEWLATNSFQMKKHTHLTEIKRGIICKIFQGVNKGKEGFVALGFEKVLSIVLERKTSAQNIH